MAGPTGSCEVSQAVASHFSLSPGQAWQNQAVMWEALKMGTKGI